MATLVLSTAGTALFGPIGGAIGAFIGQQVDNEVFRPGGREGPRLNDLRLQTSSYGTPLPRIFGTMRVAGTVVWATDLQEDRNKEGGGKGRPSATTYSYSASFAVALSARPIRAVHRIWADGKLLRGVAGDFKSETAFRLHLGGEDQAIDPLIASAEGGSGTPTYCGLALAVFENLQLADFGNRIPSLTFEVEADEGAVSFVDIVDELSAGQVTADSSATLSGYAGHGSNLRGAIETLVAALPHHLVCDADTIRFTDTLSPPVSLTEDALGAKVGEQGRARYQMERQGADKAPAEIALRYYEPARDYQAGLQRARMEGAGQTGERTDLPATLSAPRAKAIAEARLERLWTEKTRASITLPWAAMTIRPGDAIQIPGESGSWRVSAFNLERMAVSLECVRATGASAVMADAAAPGRVVSDPDLEHGPTRLELLDLPALDDTLYAAPHLLVAAAGISPGWRSANLEVSFDGGASFGSLGRTSPPAVIGAALGVLGIGQSALLDTVSAIDVALLHGDMWLTSATDAALVSGANLAVLGEELIQFGGAEALGGNRFRLSRLLRGRRGTEWAMTGHVFGERFVLLDPGTVKPLETSASALGGSVELLATGLGDAGVPVSVSDIVHGRSVRPPTPVHLSAQREADGAIRFSWVRRSRIGWAWISGADAPLGEEEERWRVSIEPLAGQSRTQETDGATLTYSIADQLADGTDAVGIFLLSVVQLGALAESDPAARRTFHL
ncbi:phage tail protein [Parasphingopyxis lamellibrachiae]|uniref:Putative tail protein n=1 Tax=Parasphingopyxis lamellibrachiae TaxID=680125 RepID=A0A3D9FDX6_9SPHN|nr:phage tail protein [Parasphingopyxis lamellibrachiae]RED16035.1 putative tail protein [Parasphingopyxis lamellibrachiae]